MNSTASTGSPERNPSIFSGKSRPSSTSRPSSNTITVSYPAFAARVTAYAAGAKGAPSVPVSASNLPEESGLTNTVSGSKFLSYRNRLLIAAAALSMLSAGTSVERSSQTPRIREDRPLPSVVTVTVSPTILSLGTIESSEVSSGSPISMEGFGKDNTSTTAPTISRTASRENRKMRNP